VIRDVTNPDPANVTRVLLCAGKVYYDLAKAREKRELTDTAIVRVEQLYPLPAEEIGAAVAAYPSVEDIVWVQEEPANQGAWPFVAMNLPEHLGEGPRLRPASRPASASPAAGSHNQHEIEQAQLVDAAFG
jgi:multifunctional 2-oxoglutarate metabolism enzyme